MLIDLDGASPAHWALAVLLAVVATGLLGPLVVGPRWRAHQRARRPRKGDVWSLCDGRLVTVLSVTDTIVLSGVSIPGDRDLTRRRIKHHDMGEWITLLQRADAHLVRRGPRRRAGT